jgi:SAM-dependent methyltransferase
MSRMAPFAIHHEQYDRWFDEHPAAYVSELLALRPFVPSRGRGLEIGVGTGRFAAPLGIRVGLDPALQMLGHAARRGVSVVAGVAEALPFPDAGFDYALVVTTICFVESPGALLAEARRVLRPGGTLVIGFIDGHSDTGRQYLSERARGVFYQDVTFHGASDVERMLVDARFTIRGSAQTLVGAIPAIGEVQPLRPGTGQGAFAVISATRER